VVYHASSIFDCTPYIMFDIWTTSSYIETFDIETTSGLAEPPSGLEGRRVDLPTGFPY